jgi:H+-transporting ATPase
MQIATVIAAKANWDFASVNGVGWGWAGVIWLYSLITYLPLDVIKFAVRYTLSGKAWDLVTEQRVCFFSCKIIFTTFIWLVTSKV